MVSIQRMHGTCQRALRDPFRSTSELVEPVSHLFICIPVNAQYIFPHSFDVSLRESLALVWGTGVDCSGSKRFYGVIVGSGRGGLWSFVRQSGQGRRCECSQSVHVACQSSKRDIVWLGHVCLDADRRHDDLELGNAAEGGPWYLPDHTPRDMLM
jgi:hypothetical protein